MENKNHSNEEVAKLAVDIEINKVGSPIWTRSFYVWIRGIEFQTK